MSSKLCQVFSVTRHSPELIGPARPTARVVKQLSDIDDHEGLKFQVPLIFFYKNNPSPSVRGKDPVKVIREVIRKSLVFYYPLAGRLQEEPNRKLTVDCNNEGVMFIEADANFTLELLGDAIRPPCPYLDELLYNVPGSDGTIGCPILLIQVTRLICGGFVITMRFSHTMCDGFGFMQFLKAIEEMVQGADTPSLLPVWKRELLNARNPPQITCSHLEYEELETLLSLNPNEMDQKSFYFGSKEIKALRYQLPLHLRDCTRFELITACLWKCRTIALELDPGQIVRLACAINSRAKHYNMQLPPGYYGNAFVYPAVCSKVSVLCENPLGYAVELVKKVKEKMSEEYIRSVADHMVTKGRPGPPLAMENFIVSETSRIGFGEVDLGWGKPVYGGIASAVSIISFYVKYRNKDDKEDGILVPIHLPLLAMERFRKELNKNTQGPLEDV